jgi:hypothetical protein
MWAWNWRLHLTRYGRLRARNTALRKQLHEATVLKRVWRMSAEHHAAHPQPPAHGPHHRAEDASPANGDLSPTTARHRSSLATRATAAAAPADTARVAQNDSRSTRYPATAPLYSPRCRLTHRRRSPLFRSPPATGTAAPTTGAAAPAASARRVRKPRCSQDSHARVPAIPEEEGDMAGTRRRHRPCNSGPVRTGAPGGGRRSRPAGSLAWSKREDCR